MTLKTKYQEKCDKPSDINQLLPFLKLYADRCEHITEMGTRYFVSTYAFLASKAKQVITYDIEEQLQQFLECKSLCDEENKSLKYIIGDTLKVEIEETDFLFIDTWHVYNQLRQELELHHNKVRKYIGFHDTTTYAHVGEDEYHNVTQSGGFNSEGRGLMDAINEFLENHSEWMIDLKKENNNGLTIIKRIK